MARRKRSSVACVDCGCTVEPHDYISSGMCANCTAYLRRTGEHRTPEIAAEYTAEPCRHCQKPTRRKFLTEGLCSPCRRQLKRRPRPTSCRNCNKVPKRRRNRSGLTKGLCDTCRKFFKENGNHRPPQGARRKTKPLCANCGQDFAKWVDLCNACGLYRARTGQMRPERLWNKDDRRCKRCGRPWIERKFSDGRCPACSSHFRRHGCERPMARIKALYPFGWCDCGQPAVTKVKVKSGYLQHTAVREKSIEYALCAECAEAEAPFAR